MAAEQGHVEAQNSLGSLYYSGHGVQRNEKEAKRWWQVAASQGSEEALQHLHLLNMPRNGERDDTAVPRGMPGM